MKGFLFAIMATAFAVLVLSSASFYAAEASAPQPSARDVALVAEDIAWDLNAIENFSFSAKRSGGKTILSFNDSLPHAVPSAAAQVNEFVSFVNNDYSKATDHNISLSTPQARLQARFTGSALTAQYYHDSFQKNSFNLSSPSSIEGYSLRVRLNTACDKQKCASIEDDWTWQTTGVFITFDIKDINGDAVVVNKKTSGFVSPTALNSFRLALVNQGVLKVVQNGNVLSLQVTNTRAQTQLNATYSGEARVSFERPVSLLIDGANFTSVVLARG